MIDETKYRTHLIYILTILAIITGVFFWGKREGAAKERLKFENQLLQQEVNELRQQIDTATVRIKQVSSERVLERAAAKVAESALKMRVAKLLKSLPKMDAHDTIVVMIRDSVQNQVISLQDSLIQHLDLDLEKTAASYEKEIGLMDQKFEAQAKISELYRTSYEAKVKDERKERRGKRFFRTLSVGLGVALGVVILTNQ